MANHTISKSTQADAVCSSCGTLLSTFLERGRCGCPNCYRTFGDYLRPLLLKSSGLHCGRVPLAVKKQEYQKQVRALEKKIAAAYAAGDQLAVEQYAKVLRTLREDV